MSSDTHLAAYGTLRPGQPNNHQLAAMRGTWTSGTVHGRLSDQGWGSAQGYPGLTLDAEGEAVEVDIFQSDQLPQHWARLDAFEGDGYRRVVTSISTPAGDVDVCIYVLA